MPEYLLPVPLVFLIGIYFSATGIDTLARKFTNIAMAEGDVGMLIFRQILASKTTFEACLQRKRFLVPLTPFTQ